MEDEPQKKKLDLDWNVLLPPKENGPPLEVLRVGAQDEERKQMDLPFSIDDHNLREKVLRLRSQINSGVTKKLPDNGEKLRNSLKLHEDELERRKQARLKKDNEYGKSIQSWNSDSPGACNGFSSVAPSSHAHSKSQFFALFSGTLEDKPDLSSRISVNTFSKEHSIRGCGNHQNTRLNGLSSKRGRLEKGSLRQSTLILPTNSDDGHEQRFPGAQNSITSSSFYHPHQDQESPRRVSKRIKASQLQSSRQSRTKEVSRTKECETVVVLDEEDCQLPEARKKEDERAQRKEAKIFYPSRDDPQCVELCYSEIKCLAPQSFLSSEVMNFYIRYLQRPMSPTGRSRSDYYFFSTYFYAKVKEAVSCKSSEKDMVFSKLRRWWKGVNIFEKAYILLPIHENVHWSLVIICLPKKEDESGLIILHLDSLGMHDSKQIFGNVRSFLREEWEYLYERGVPRDLPIDEKQIKVPQQNNDYDCGIFVLYFMERFIEEAPERLGKRDLAMFGRRWFKPEEASCLRGRIRTLLDEEFDNSSISEHENKEPSPKSSSDSAGCSEDIKES